MLKLFSIATDIDTEYTVVGVVNFEDATAQFEGHLNGVPFCQSDDYEKVREEVMQRVEGNTPRSSHEQCH
jgi:hypothetical protein